MRVDLPGGRKDQREERLRVLPERLKNRQTESSSLTATGLCETNDVPSFQGRGDRFHLDSGGVLET